MTAVLFDLDGTIADTLHNIMETSRLTLEKLGLDYDEALVRSLIGIPLAQSAEIVAGKDKAQLFLDVYHDFFVHTKKEKYQAFPGMKELIVELKENGFKLAVVTAKLYPGTKLALADLGMEEYFDALVTASDDVKPKPSPEPACLALEKMGASGEKFYFVGDSPFDIRSGKGAGAITIAVLWGAANREIMAKEDVDYLVEDVAELRKILLAT